MMTKSAATALAVARPGRLRDSLNALLLATPCIVKVDNADDGPTALRMLAESAPAIVFLDSDLLDNGAYAILRQIKAHWPQTRCIVLADDAQQRHHARANGADEALLRGFPVAELCATVERLLRDKNKGVL